MGAQAPASTTGKVHFQAEQLFLTFYSHRVQKSWEVPVLHSQGQFLNTNCSFCVWKRTFMICASLRKSSLLLWCHFSALFCVPGLNSFKHCRMSVNRGMKKIYFFSFPFWVFLVIPYSQNSLWWWFMDLRYSHFHHIQGKIKSYEYLNIDFFFIFFSQRKAFTKATKLLAKQAKPIGEKWEYCQIFFCVLSEL